MSVSSHLTPDPERRLRLIHEGIISSLRWADVKLWCAAFLAAVQAAVLSAAPDTGLRLWGLLLLGAAALPALLGVSPLADGPGAPPADTGPRKPLSPLSLLDEADIAVHSQAEMSGFLDRYLGGGITATPYYEDLVGQIVISARVTVRKRRLFGAACALIAAAQLLLLAALALR